MSATATKPKKKAGPAKVFGGTIDIPARCKPSKGMNSEPSRPILMHAYLRRRDDGLWLLTTDAYIAIALKVKGDAQEGFIPAGALKHMEQGRHGEQISETAWRVQTEQYAETVFDIAPIATGAVKFPDLEKVGLWEPVERVFGPKDDIAVGLNPVFVKRIGDAFGSRESTGCRFEFAGPLKPVRVTPLRSDIEAVALQMPIRLNV